MEADTDADADTDMRTLVCLRVNSICSLIAHCLMQVQSSFLIVLINCAFHLKTHLLWSSFARYAHFCTFSHEWKKMYMKIVFVSLFIFIAHFSQVAFMPRKRALFQPHLKKKNYFLQSTRWTIGCCCFACCTRWAGCSVSLNKVVPHMKQKTIFLWHSA